MPILSVKNYDVSLVNLNETVCHVFVNAAVDRGGERHVVQLRQHERGLPLTLRENYSSNGTLLQSTEARDVPRLEAEFQQISKHLMAGNIICVPIYPLTDELLNLEKHSPKMAGYLRKRLEGLQIKSLLESTRR
jgi:hypothetical protein